MKHVFFMGKGIAQGCSGYPDGIFHKRTCLCDLFASELRNLTKAVKVLSLSFIVPTEQNNMIIAQFKLNELVFDEEP
jgi:hypothetical protein